MTNNITLFITVSWLFGLVLCLDLCYSFPARNILCHKCMNHKAILFLRNLWWCHGAENKPTFYYCCTLPSFLIINANSLFMEQTHIHPIGLISFLHFPVILAVSPFKCVAVCSLRFYHVRLVLPCHVLWINHPALVNFTMPHCLTQWWETDPRGVWSFSGFHLRVTDV